MAKLVPGVTAANVGRQQSASNKVHAPRGSEGRAQGGRARGDRGGLRRRARIGAPAVPVAPPIAAGGLPDGDRAGAALRRRHHRRRDDGEPLVRSPARRLATDPSYPGAGQVDGLTGSESNPDGRRPVTVNLAGERRHPRSEARLGFLAPRLQPGAQRRLRARQRRIEPGRGDELPPAGRRPRSSTRSPTSTWSATGGSRRSWGRPGRTASTSTRRTSAGRKKNRPMGLDPPPDGLGAAGRSLHPGQELLRGRRSPGTASPSPPTASRATTPSSPSRSITSSPTPSGESCRASRSSIPTSGSATGIRPTTSASPRRSWAASTARWRRASHWPRSLLVVVFDEHGGFYDHVPPPTVPDPDPDFRQIGFRVPALVIGPSVRPGRGGVDPVRSRVDPGHARDAVRDREPRPAHGRRRRSVRLHRSGARRRGSSHVAARCRPRSRSPPRCSATAPLRRDQPARARAPSPRAGGLPPRPPRSALRRTSASRPGCAGRRTSRPSG